MDDVVLESFSAQMHVRQKAEQSGVIRQRAVDFDAIIIDLRRDHEMIIGQLQRDHPLFRRLLCQDKAHACPIPCRTAVRDVMHLEDEIRSGGNEFSHTVGPIVG